MIQFQSISQSGDSGITLSVSLSSFSQSIISQESSVVLSFIHRRLTLQKRELISLFLSEERNHFSLLITLYHAKTKHSLTTLGIQHAHNRRTRIGALRVL